MKTLFQSAVRDGSRLTLMFILIANISLATSTGNSIFHYSKKKPQTSSLELRGLVQDSRSSLENAVVSIVVDSTVIFTTRSDRSGHCKIVLPLNGRFIIEFSCPGYVPKRICVNTKVPAARSGAYRFRFTIDLFEQIKGLDVSVLDNPVAIITFNNFTNAFDYDYNYTLSINKSIEKMYDEYYSLKELEKTEAEKK